jgi:two-component system, NtrC family, sensor kinase
MTDNTTSPDENAQPPASSNGIGSSETACQMACQTEKLAVLGETIAGIAHELNNPMTGILGYAQLILGQTQDSGTRERARCIVEEALRCKRIIDNLLAFAREGDSDKSWCDINELLQNAAMLCHYQLRSDGIGLNMRLAPGLSPVLGSQDGLYRVFLSIIHNAHRALTQAESDERTLTITTETRDDMTHVCIRDNGPGMPRHVLDRVFDPFYSTSHDRQSVGLGLSVAYGIVREHGGGIRVDSEPGRGTAVFIEFPLSRSA